MNFGWSLLQQGHNGIDTAVHEIGHTLGFNHEHQNPFAGIEWDEAAVIKAMAARPNRWDEKKTRWNILRKISPDEVQGSRWDPNSIMHYPFGPGLIIKPTQYQNGLTPAGGLSDYDRAWVRHFYPPLGDDLPTLELLQSRDFTLLSGQEIDFAVEPKATGAYKIAKFGKSDVIMGLDEVSNEATHKVAVDDDMGHERDAAITATLTQGKKYVLRIRLCYTSSNEKLAVMMTEA